MSDELPPPADAGPGPSGRADAAAELLAAARAVADDAGAALVPPLPGQVLDSIPRACRATFHAAACSIAVIVEQEHELEYVAAAGEGADKVVGMRLPIGRGISGWVAASGQALGISEVQADPRVDRERAEATGYMPTSMIVIPIADGDDPLGVLSILDPTDIDAGSLAIAGDFARHAALTILQSRSAQRVGLTVVTALAGSAGLADADLTALLFDLGERSTNRQQQERAAVAELFQRLSALGPLEHSLALDLLHDAVSYAEKLRDRL